MQCMLTLFVNRKLGCYSVGECFFKMACDRVPSGRHDKCNVAGNPPDRLSFAYSLFWFMNSHVCGTDSLSDSPVHT